MCQDLFLAFTEDGLTWIDVLVCNCIRGTSSEDTDDVRDCDVGVDRLGDIDLFGVSLTRLLGEISVKGFAVRCFFLSDRQH